MQKNLNLCKILEENRLKGVYDSEQRLSSYSEAVAKAKETENGQHLNLVIGSKNGHVLTFTRDGFYSKVGGRGGEGGSSIQERQWLSNENSQQYFMVQAVKYTGGQLPVFYIIDNKP